MITVRGCQFPGHLHYDVPNHIWYEPLADGTIRLGITMVAIALSGDILVFTPKRVGFDFEKGRSCATFECGKWVGPARAAFDGVVVSVNEELIERPTIVNGDPYGAGWMLTARPNGADPLAGLVTGDRIAPAYEGWMHANLFAGCGTR
jgi:glycine cleavage system H protein